MAAANSGDGSRAHRPYLESRRTTFVSCPSSQGLKPVSRLRGTAPKVAPRWSIDGWTYYIWQVGDQCQFILAGLALAALGYCLVSRQFARHNTLWAAWTICWYLLFSYFDNKQPRFVTFVIPGVTILGCSFAWAFLKGRYWKQRIVFAGLVIIIVLQVLSGFRAELPPGI